MKNNKSLKEIRCEYYSKYYSLTDDEINKEFWKDIPGFEGLYFISNFGRIKSKNGRHNKAERLLRPSPTFTNVTIKICNDINLAIARVVLITFVGDCPPDMECCHNDGNYLNNKLSNLRWDTHSNNNYDKIKHNTMPIGENHTRSKLNDKFIVIIRNHYPQISSRRLGEIFNVSRRLISKIVSRKLWRHIP